MEVIFSVGRGVMIYCLRAFSKIEVCSGQFCSSVFSKFCIDISASATKMGDPKEHP